MDLVEAMRDMLDGKYTKPNDGISYRATPDGSGVLRTVVEIDEQGKPVIKTVEITVLCHFCGAQKAVNTEESLHPMHRPRKWALVMGGTPRKPKRFFICADCSRIIAHGDKAPESSKNMT